LASGRGSIDEGAGSRLESTIEETAAVLNVSIDTAKRDWRMTKAWLISQL